MQSDVHSEFEIVFTICFISKLFLYKIKCLCIRWGTLDCLWWREGRQQKVWCRIFVAHLYTWVCEGDYSPMFEKERVLCVCVWAFVFMHTWSVCLWEKGWAEKIHSFKLTWSKIYVHWYVHINGMYTISKCIYPTLSIDMHTH